MQIFCTIITYDYLPYAQALSKSLSTLSDKYQLHVLVVDKGRRQVQSDSFEIIELDDIDAVLKNDLIEKYLYKDQYDEFRWSMKAVLLAHLLQRYEKVIFVDPDIAFYLDPGFLFTELETFNVLLTPHWREHVPIRDPNNFSALQTSGLYNAGFVGVSHGAERMLEWWAETCLYECVIDHSRGLFVDQSYLDMVPIYFDNVGIVKHRGCNIAAWNRKTNVRSVSDSGVVINDSDPLIFIHFTNSTIRSILSGVDEILTPHLQEWLGWRGVSLVAEKERLFSNESSKHSQKKKQSMISRLLLKKTD